MSKQQTCIGHTDPLRDLSTAQRVKQIDATKVAMSSQAHVQLLEIDQYNSLNLESVQSPEETVEDSNVRSALRDPIFRFVMAGFVSLFALLGLAAAVTF